MSAQNVISKFRESISFKMLVIGILVFLLLVPSMMVQGLIKERMQRKNTVMHQITNAWSNEQTITGPMLMLPYNEYYKKKDGEIRSVRKLAYLLPEILDVQGELLPDIRYRGIYKAVVYNADLKLSGRFDFSPLKSLHINKEDYRLDEAEIIVGITDMRGVTESIELEISDSDNKIQIVQLNPVVEQTFGTNAMSPVKLKSLDSYLDFNLMLNLNGSKSFAVVPVGKVSTTSLKSNWNAPSFIGSFLPDQRNITEDSFTADWKVLHLNRAFPQAWKVNSPHIRASSYGVSLLMINDKYQQVMRTAKYALMFIMFTFLAFFMSEVMTKNRVHPIQYLFVGTGIIIFYSLLLAFSEHMSFVKSYVISSLATVSLISLYARSALKKDRLALIVACVLSILFVYLYILLQQEAYALLMGSIGLFIVLGGVMYLTRKIEWYGVSSSEEEY